MLGFVTAEVSVITCCVWRTRRIIPSDEPVKFNISFPNLEGLAVSGAGHIEVKGMNNEKFEIDSSGAPTINVSGKDEANRYR